MVGIYHDDKENISSNISYHNLDFFGKNTSLPHDLAINITKKLIILGADIYVPNYYDENLIYVINNDDPKNKFSKEYSLDDLKYFSYLGDIIDSRFE